MSSFSFGIFSVSAYSFFVSLNSSHFVACVDIKRYLIFYFFFWMAILSIEECYWFLNFIFTLNLKNNLGVGRAPPAQTKHNAKAEHIEKCLPRKPTEVKITWQFGNKIATYLTEKGLIL